MKTKTRSTGFWIFFALLMLTTLTILELNKNNLTAWAVCLALLGLYAFICALRRCLPCSRCSAR